MAFFASAVDDPLKKWIKSFLFNNQLKVFVDFETSSETEVLSGVLHGSLLFSTQEYYP